MFNSRGGPGPPGSAAPGYNKNGTIHNMFDGVRLGKN